MSFKKFLKELNGKRVEGELIFTFFISLVTSLIIIGLSYFLILRNLNGSVAKYGFSLFFSALSIAILLPAVRQIRAYKTFPCMSGMMIGMTIGMVSSFLSGFYVAMTNGMFIGGFFGVIVGGVFGIWTGKSCGIMGIMEGAMAAFMGGLMGAMTAFMLLNDHLKLTGILSIIIETSIIIMLNYMIYNETKNEERQINEEYFFTIIVTIILMIVTTLLILYGPRSILFS